ncbi:MAG: hypothetical protein K2M11_03970, partial [Paramuribaculum sp.]|nr:hypothetical protein [Paramuribaculum sp.]
YQVSVRGARLLPRASFRFGVTPDTLAVGYALPAIGVRSGLTPVRLCPCRANNGSDARTGRHFLFVLTFLYCS